MASYTVMFQYLNADFSDWVHDERTVAASDSKEALQLVVRAVQLEYPGRKCVAKQIRKATNDSQIAATARSIVVGEYTIVQAEPNRAVCLHRNVGQPDSDAMEVEVAELEAVLRAFFDRTY